MFAHDGGDSGDTVTFSRITMGVSFERGGESWEFDVFGFKEYESDAKYTDNLEI